MLPTRRSRRPRRRRHGGGAGTRFPPGVGAKLGAYVYLLVDPRTGRPFFVGRGRGDRCFRHVEAARTLAGRRHDGRASSTPLDRIREAESDGRTGAGRHPAPRPHPGRGAPGRGRRSNDALGLGQETRLGSRRRPAVELGAELAKRARFKRSHPVVLLRVGPHGADTAYGHARHGWRIGQRWVDTASPRSPRWAVGGGGRPGRRRLPDRRLGAVAGHRRASRCRTVVLRRARPTPSSAAATSGAASPPTWATARPPRSPTSGAGPTG